MNQKKFPTKRKRIRSNRDEEEGDSDYVQNEDPQDDNFSFTQSMGQTINNNQKQKKKLRKKPNNGIKANSYFEGEDTNDDEDDDEDDEEFNPDLIRKKTKKKYKKRNTLKKKTKQKKPPKKATNSTKNKTKKETLEQCTLRILSLLQKRGQVPFKDIFTELGIGYRRAYDILNVLLTTPLVSKKGKKRENKIPYVFLDGRPLQEVVDIATILEQTETEKKQIEIFNNLNNRLKREVENPNSTNLDNLFKDLENEEYDLTQFLNTEQD
ncbi:transcription factor e2f [Anaeramoeba flamelloides]|uniref:Transcription factor e2f n=1 Tax=Anaeramoeba flamelloides TaxID=1746091 RepID=A0AAV7YHB2_9EUKA|nr:transcription factor e2f [Anaeramoeba flamelloides]